MTVDPDADRLETDAGDPGAPAGGDEQPLAAQLAAVVERQDVVAAVGATEAAFSATALVAEVAKTATYTRAYAESNGFLTLLSDGERLTGAYALGPEAGEWLQQATLAIRAEVPLEVVADTIQPFPSFSEMFLFALTELGTKVPAAAAA